MLMQKGNNENRKGWGSMSCRRIIALTMAFFMVFSLILPGGSTFSNVYADPYVNPQLVELAANNIEVSLADPSQTIDRNSQFGININYTIPHDKLSAAKVVSDEGKVIWVYDLTAFIGENPLQDLVDLSEGQAGNIMQGTDIRGSYTISGNKVYLDVKKEWLFEQDSEVKGTFALSMSLDAEKVGSADEVSLRFPGAKDDFTLQFSSGSTSQNSKMVSGAEGGNVAVTPNGDGTYDVTYQVSVTPNTYHESAFNVIDTLTSTHQSFDVSSFSVTYNDTLDSWKEKTVDLSSYVSVSGQTATVDLFQALQDSNAKVVKDTQYRITYTTKVTADALGEELVNNVKTTWESGGTTGDTTATVTPISSIAVDKSYTKIDDNTYTYTITVGDSSTEMSNVVISDYMNDLQYLTGSITVNGTTLDTYNSDFTDGTFVDTEKNLFSYDTGSNFGMGPVVIQYQVKIPDSTEAPALSGIKNINNRVTATGENREGKDSTSFQHTFGTTDAGTVDKSFVAFDATNNRIQWSIAVSNTGTTDLENAYIVDTASANTLDNEYYFNEYNSAIDWSSVEITDGTGAALAATDYSVDTANRKITFANLPAGETYTVTLSTYPTTGDLTDGFTYRNYIDLYNQYEVSLGNDSDQKKYSSNQITVEKSVQYDEETKEYEWTVVINKNRSSIDPDRKVYFTDSIPAGMEYIAGSMSISCLGHSTLDGKDYWNDVVTGDAMIELSITNNVMGPVDVSKAFNNKDIYNGPYSVGTSGLATTVKYRTKLTAAEKEEVRGTDDTRHYTNVFNVTDSTGNTTYATDSETADYTYKFLSKKDLSPEVIDETDKDIINFRIDVNEDALTLNEGDDLILEDVLNTNIELITSGYAGKYGFTVEDATGKDLLASEEATVSYNDDARLITVTVPDSTHVIVKYSVRTRAKGDIQVDNEAILIGGGKQHSDGTSENHKVSSHSATIQGGGIQLHKIDEHNITKGLPGAIFKLYTVPFDSTTYVMGNPVLVNTGDITSTDGYYTIEEEYLQEGNLYYWQETKSPDDYQLDDTPHYFAVYKGNVAGSYEAAKTVDNRIQDANPGVIVNTIELGNYTWTVCNRKRTIADNLEIKKTVVSALASDKEIDFEFTVTLDDTTVSGTYGDLTFTDGVATTTLKDGESAVASGLPVGVGYTVTETAVAGFETTKTNDTGEISDTKAVVEFTNTSHGSFKISKSVTANGQTITSSDLKKTLAGDYTFTVYTDQECTKPYQRVEGVDLTVTVTMGNDGNTVTSAEIQDMPAGDYWIKETTPTNGSTPVDNPVKVTVNPGEVGTSSAQAAFTNDIEVGEIRFLKTFNIPNTVNYKMTDLTPLTFQLLRNGAIVRTFTYYDVYVALSTGHAYYTIGNLEPASDYVLTETNADGLLTAYNLVLDAQNSMTSKDNVQVVKAGHTDIELINTYKKMSGEIALKAVKTVNGEAITAGGVFDGKFNFTLEEITTGDVADKLTTTQTKSNVAGSISFDTISYTASGVHTYRITEGASVAVLGIAIDPTQYDITVTVAPDEADASLLQAAITNVTKRTSDGTETTVAYSDGAGIAFNNVSERGSISIAKDLTVSGTTDASTIAKVKDQEFDVTLTLTAPAGSSIPETLEAEITKTGSASRTVTITVDEGEGTLSLKADETATIGNLPAGTTAVVTESKDTSLETKGYTYDATAAGDGYSRSISANTVAEVTLSNSYTMPKTSVMVTKIWAGDSSFTHIRPESIGVQLKSGTTNVGDPVNLTAATNWTYTWNDLAEYDADLNLISYSVVETDDSTRALSAQYTSGTPVEVQSETVDKAYEITNTAITGDLKVTKALTSPVAADADKDFAFSVVLNDTSINGTFGDMTFTGGVAEFTLKGGTSKEAVGLPNGTGYSIYETGADDFNVTFAAADVGVISNSKTTVTVTNVRKTGSLVVDKTFALPTGTTVPDTALDALSFQLKLKNDVVATFTYADIVSAKAGGADGYEIADLVLADDYELIETNAGGLLATYNLVLDEAISDVDLTGIKIEEGQKKEVDLTNTYKQVQGGIALKAVKTVDGQTPAAGGDYDGKFTFQLHETTTGTVPDRLTADLTKANAAGTVNFDAIGYTAPAVHTYQITEASVDASTGVNADATQYFVTVTVTEDTTDPAKLNAEVTSVTKKTADGTETTVAYGDGAGIAFNNTRKTGELVVKKEVVSTDADDEQINFSFTVTLDDTTISGTYGGMTFTNGVATFTLKHNETCSASGLPVGTGFSIEETPVDGFEQVYTGQTGTIADGTSTSTVQNIRLHYADYQLVAKKVAEGLLADDFSFKLERVKADGSVDSTFTPVTVKNAADGTVAFGVTFTSKQVETVYYHISETDVENVTTASPEDGYYIRAVTTYDSTTYTYSVKLYRFAETATPGTGFPVETNWTEVQAGTPTAFTFENVSAMKIQKKDSDGMLAGAGLQIYEGASTQGTAVRSFTSGITAVDVTGLKYNTVYTLHEAQTPGQDYLPADDIYFMIRPDGVYQLASATDTEGTKVNNGLLTMIDVKRGEALPKDISAKLTKSHEDIYGENVKLSAGEYEFTMTPISYGGVLDQDTTRVPKTARNAANGTATFGPLTYLSTDAGKSYAYLVKETDPSADTAAMDMDETKYILVVTVEKVIGTNTDYELQLTKQWYKAPNGTEADIIPANEIDEADVKLVNTDRSGILKITKTIKGDVTPEEAAGQLQFTVTDENGKVLVVKDGTTEKRLENLILDQDFTKVGEDVYELELRVPAGQKYIVSEVIYDVDGAVLAKVTGNGVALEKKNGIYSMTTDTVQPGTTPTAADYENTYKKGKLVITKTIKGDVTPEEAAGQLEFTITNETTGKKEVVNLSKFTFDADTKTYTYEMDARPGDVYTVTETDYDVDGAILESVTHQIMGGNVKEGASATGIRISSTEQTRVDFEDDYKDDEGVIHFSKFVYTDELCSDTPDATAELEGVTFRAVNTDDPTIYADATSNKKGQVIFKKLPAGTYKVYETEVPETVILDDTVYYAVIRNAAFEGLTDKDGKKIEKGRIINDVYRTDIEFTKVNEKNPQKALEGSTYALYKKVLDGSEEMIAKSTTDKDGKIIFHGVLTNVEYSIKEIVAPDGYYVSYNPMKIGFKVVEDASGNKKVVVDEAVFDDGDKTVTIDENGNITWLEPEVLVSVTKVDQDGSFVSGATLRIEDMDGNIVIPEWVSTNETYTISGKLIAGHSYKLVEVKAPDGYEIAGAVTFKVSNEKVKAGENKSIDLTMIDKKIDKNTIPPDTPKTNDDTPLLPVAGLMVLSLAGIVTVGSEKRKLRKNRKKK